MIKLNWSILKNPLLLITVLTSVFTLFLLEKQLFIGVPYYDVFVYLNNALIFAGLPVGNLSVIYLSPLMPFLTSIVFRTGIISVGVLFFLDGILFTVGAVFFYLLLKERFNTIPSFAGVLIYLSYPLTMAWAVSGGIDFPGVSLSIITIYILVKGVKKDSRLLYILFPIFILAFLARYTSAILIFPIIIYLLINSNRSENFIKTGIGVLVGLIVLTPFLIFVIFKLGNLSAFWNIFTSTLLGSGATVNDLGYNPLKLYFLNNLLNYISVGPLKGIYGIIQSPSRGIPTLLSYTVSIFVTVGLALYIYPALKKWFNINQISRPKAFKILILMLLLGSGIYSFFYSSYMLTEIVFLVILLFTYYLIKNDDPSLKIDMLFLSWFGAFFIFHSIIPLKEDRYFITMLPGLTYFIILGLESFAGKLNSYIKYKYLKTAIILGVSALLLICSTATLTGHVNQESYGFYIQSASNWLKEYDPDYQNKVIYSNYDPAATWGLKKEVKFGVPRLYVNLESFSNYLRGGGADYYIDAYSTNPEIPGFHIIFSRETVTIYQRD